MRNIRKVTTVTTYRLILQLHLVATLLGRAILDVVPRTLTCWIKRFNQFGVDGLTYDAERPGRPTKILPAQHE